MSDETEGLTKRLHSRREFLKIAGVAGATVGLGAGLGGLVTACGGTEETTTTAGPATTAGPTTTAAAGATTTTAVAATTTTGMSYAGGKKVLDSFYTLDQVFWQQWDRGAQAACAALGLEHIRLVDNSDVNVQISGFENAPTQEINMAISIAWSQASSAQIGKICQDNRIWWCNVWSNSPWSTPLDIGDYYVTWITASDEIAGYTVAKGLFEKVGSEGEFIHIEGQPGNSASDLRNVGVDKALAEFPKIKMVARQPGNFNRSESRAVMDDLLVAHPNVKCAMGQNDDAAIGVWNSCEAAGKTTVAVGGIDGIPEMIDLVEQGKDRSDNRGASAVGGRLSDRYGLRCRQRLETDHSGTDDVLGRGAAEHAGKGCRLQPGRLQRPGDRLRLETDVQGAQPRHLGSAMPALSHRSRGHLEIGGETSGLSDPAGLCRLEVDWGVGQDHPVVQGPLQVWAALRTSEVATPEASM